MKVSLYGPWFLIAQRPHHLANFLNANEHVTEIHTTRGFRPTIPSLSVGHNVKIGQQLSARLHTVPFIGDAFKRYNTKVEQNVYRDFEHSGADLHVHFSAPKTWSAKLGPDVKRLVYDCMDDFSGFTGSPSDLDLWEDELCERADSIWVVSKHLENKLSRYANKIRYVPNGVNYTHFSIAQQLRSAKAQLTTRRPRLIYIGTIFDWFDANLVGEVAKILHDWDIDLIGPVRLSAEQRQSLDQPNIHFLGTKDYKDLPEQLANADVAMIPFVINDLIRGTSPIKLYEYLAAGVPVVSTPMPEVLPYIQPGVVQCEETASAFAAAVRNLANATDRVACDAIAQQSSWESRFRNALVNLI